MAWRDSFIKLISVLASISIIFLAVVVASIRSKSLVRKQLRSFGLLFLLNLEPCLSRRVELSHRGSLYRAYGVLTVVVVDFGRHWLHFIALLNRLYGDLFCDRDPFETPL